MEVLVSIAVVVWSVLCIILFFKIWGMCNNVSAIRDILNNLYIDGVAKDTDKLNKMYSSSEQASDESISPKSFAIYKPENVKVEILDKDDDDVFKCRSIKDGKIYYFIKDVLEFI